MALKILTVANAPWVRSGYGVTTRLLCEIFKKLGHTPAVFAYFGLEGAPMQWEGMDIYPRGHETWGNDIVDAHFKRAGVDLVITNVDVFVLNNYGGRSFPWLPIVPIAEDPLTPGIRNALSGQMMDIVAISQYGQRVLGNAGFPSKRIYLPVPTNFFYPTSKDQMRSKMNWPDDAYIVGHVGMNRGYRKGHDILLQAFQKFLAEVPNSYLYLYSDLTQYDGVNLLALVRELGIEERIRYPASYDVTMGHSELWMNMLYNALDLYVQPSLNEGQAMPVWEALSTGLSVVATNGTAITEALEGADAILVEPINKVWNQNSSWGYEISADDLAAAMYEAYRKWGRRYVSLTNRQRAVENVSLDECALRWQDVLTDVEKVIRYTPGVRPWGSRPKIVQVSTRVTNCGIGAYTRSLMAALSDATDQECVDILNLPVNGAQVNIPAADLVHFHYEDSIWAEAAIHSLMLGLKSRGTKSICTYHTINNSVINSHLLHDDVTRALIHWPLPGMVMDDRLQIMGGMGCPVFNPPGMERYEDMRARFGFGPYDLIISTFGFASSGRGHFEVLQEMAPLLQQSPLIKVQILAPGNFLNEPGKKIVHSEVKRLAVEYGIERQVILLGEYLSDLEVLNRLWVSTVGYLYMPVHTASSSSAARFFVSARLPLVVTSSTHFADLRRGVLRVQGFSLPDFVLAIRELLGDPAKRTRLSNEHVITYEQFNWPRFAEHYLAAYKRVLAA